MHHAGRWYRPILAGLFALMAVAVTPAAALAKPDANGYVYVNDNTAGTNTIAGFARQSDGSLIPLPGSPFKAGGAGSGSGLASQGAIQVSSDGRYVLAVDSGSNDVSVLRIRPDGSLALVHQGVVSSGGNFPVSLTEHNGLVYVANAGPGGENYTGFTLSPGGHLRPVAGSTFALPNSAQPGDVLFNSTGSNLVGTRIGTSQIDSFSVGPHGSLTPAPDSPFAAQGAGPFGSEFRPTNPSQLFVSNAHNAALDSGTVSAFTVSGDGTLSSIGNSPFADHQMAPCWVEISHDGQYLFTVNTASGSISSYSIANDGSLTLIGSTAVGNQTGLGAVDARLSRDGHTLYVDESGVDSLGIFGVNGGQLTAQGSVSLPVGAAPAGVAVR